ncbi:hypothetical protein RclHR1_05750007 [Rhizophagus clarus]|uniref:Uncharacterized protein n=1 Tax=Rhizophagus clarus TaxID=94130 RepID=A0A2Z6S1B5_9GLOM|nr:hypothetical protein RclHR1_05750007 [Rhizophagus clarus]
MESATSRSPRLGMLLTRTPCLIHRLGTTTKELRDEDYELVEEKFLRHYIYDDINSIGALCFTPLGYSPHKSPISDLITAILSSRILFSQGLAIVYDHKMKLRFPSCCQKGWHFCLVPTKQMASAESKELVHKHDDLNGVRDFLITEIYLFIELWYKQPDAMERLYANDIHTWIASKKPTFKELIRDKPRAYVIFHVLSRLNTTSVTQKTYKYDILGELKDAFGWKVKELGDKPNVEILSETLDTMHLDYKGTASDENTDKYLRDICNAEVIRVTDEL